MNVLWKFIIFENNSRIFTLNFTYKTETYPFIQNVRYVHGWMLGCMWYIGVYGLKNSKHPTFKWEIPQSKKSNKRVEFFIYICEKASHL